MRRKALTPPPPPSPTPNPRLLTDHLQWCQQRLRWTRARRRTVLFSDKSPFLLSRGDGRTCVYRPCRERYALNCVQHVDRFGDGRVMVWAAIHRGGRTALVHVVGTTDGHQISDVILQRHVVNGGMLSMTTPHHVMVRSFCSAATSRHYLGLSVRRN